MYNVLVAGMTDNYGGVERFLFNYCTNISSKEVHFDFITSTKQKMAYENELKKIGSNVFHISNRRKNFINYYKESHKFFKESQGKYDAFWYNACTLSNINYLVYSKKYGINKRIIHSHSSANMGDALTYFLHYCNRIKITKYANEYWACSKQAAMWFYGKEENVAIIPNAIDVARFSFDEMKRKIIRDKFEWNGKAVIGHIGRLSFEKNQSFLLKTFKRIHSISKETVVVFVGQGNDECKLKEEAEKLGIKEYTFFVGAQEDVQAWLSAFDLFVLPSVFEGLSIVAMEAQANGIPILASENVIPYEAKICNNFHFYSLINSPERWAEKALHILNTEQRIHISEISNRFAEKGYDIKIASKIVQDLLLER